MLGLESSSMKGMDLFKLSLMKKERVLEEMKKFKKNKGPVSVKSISIKNNKGDVFLTNISHMPLVDNNGGFQGSLMIINDVSENAKIHAELQQKRQELANLDSKFQDIQSKFKLANHGKMAQDQDLMNVKIQLEAGTKEMNHVNSLLRDKQRQIDALSKSIEIKTNELNGISVKLQEGRSALDMLDSKIVKRQNELNIDRDSPETPGGVWKESSFKMYEEIDKKFGTGEEAIKTKKLEEKE
jgi:chromosome segregation ATPase